VTALRLTASKFCSCSCSIVFGSVDQFGLQPDLRRLRMRASTLTIYIAVLGSTAEVPRARNAFTLHALQNCIRFIPLVRKCPKHAHPQTSHLQPSAASGAPEHEARPLAHHLTPTIQHVAAPVSPLDLVPDSVRE